MLPKILTEPLTWVIIIVVMSVTGWVTDRRQVRQEAELADDTKRSPFQVPEVEAVTGWPPEVQAALMHLVAFSFNRGTPMMNFDINDLRHEQLSLGNWRITVEKIED